jgi:ABC-type methionine transport system ATPase subunit
MKVRTELNFPGELKEEPIICNLCKKFAIILNILEASFSTDIGWAILIIEGTEEDLKKSFDYLKSSGVEIKDIQNID